jgi:tetratricopeptide (TPR) repeat protein
VLEWASLVALAIAIFYPSLGGPFFWDDYSLLYGRALEGSLVDIWRFPPALPLEEHYWPVTYSLFWILRAFFGYDPFYFRLVNVLLHTANTLLVYAMLRRVGTRGAWVASALFAVHPIHVESVAWIIELKDVLSGFFFLLATIVFLRGVDSLAARKRLGWWIAAGFCYALAAWSKSVAFVWPLAIALVVWAYRPQEFRSARRAIVCYLAAGAVLLGLDLITAHRFSHAEVHLGLAQRAELVGRAFWWYLAKLVWPAPLAALYPRWTLGEGELTRYLPSLALILAAGATALAAWRHLGSRKVLVWFGWYFLLLAPTLGFLTHSFMVHSYVADRYQYLASIGPFAAFGIGAAQICAWSETKRPWRLAIVGGIGVLLTTYAALALMHAALYAQPEKLLRETLRHNPQSANFQTMLGAILAQRGQLEEAATYFEQASKLSPTDMSPRVNLAIVQWQAGDCEAALEQTSTVLTREPKRALMWAVRAASLARLGRHEEAIAAARKALQLETSQPLALKVLSGEITSAPVSTIPSSVAE